MALRPEFSRPNIPVLLGWAVKNTLTTTPRDPPTSFSRAFSGRNSPVLKDSHLEFSAQPISFQKHTSLVRTGAENHSILEQFCEKNTINIRSLERTNWTNTQTTSVEKPKTARQKGSAKNCRGGILTRKSRTFFSSRSGRTWGFPTSQNGVFLSRAIQAL